MNIQRKKKLEQLWEIRQYQNTENMPLAAKVNNNLYPLSYEVEEEAEITFLDITDNDGRRIYICLLYTSPSPRDSTSSRMPSSA